MNSNVTVSRETVVSSSVVREGNKVFNFSTGKSGVKLTFGKTSITVPNGALGVAVVRELQTMLGTSQIAPAEKVKRTRRTKAQIEADALAASANSDTSSRDSEETV